LPQKVWDLRKVKTEPIRTSADDIQRLKGYLEQTKERVTRYVSRGDFKEQFRPQELRRYVYCYPRLKSKAIRPALLLLSCGAVGGDEAAALPAAAAVEMLHTWSLVHDDIIDRDERRRGEKTVHVLAAEDARRRWRLRSPDAEHYGTSLAILAGDSLLGFSVVLMAQLAERGAVAPVLVVSLVQEMIEFALSAVIEGETLDIQFSHEAASRLTAEKIERMLARKTAALLAFSARTGALIGLAQRQKRAQPKACLPARQGCGYQHTDVQALEKFGHYCGLAFQLQDDILGLTGDERVLGKPVGSDLREGKRTTVLLYALGKASSGEKEKILGALGNRDLTKRESVDIARLIAALGGIERAQKRANEYVKKALRALEALPETPQRRLLSALAHYIVSRSY
jgi:geranylgeranyl diphosphate synthase type I